MDFLDCLEHILQRGVPRALCIFGAVGCDALNAFSHAPWVLGGEISLNFALQIPAVRTLLATLRAEASPDLDAASLAFSRD